MDSLVKQSKGRIFSEDILGVLEQVLEIARETSHEAKVYELSPIADRVRAMNRGVMKTPMAIISGKRYQGFEEILRRQQARPIREAGAFSIPAHA